MNISSALVLNIVITLRTAEVSLARGSLSGRKIFLKEATACRQTAASSPVAHLESVHVRVPPVGAGRVSHEAVRVVLARADTRLGEPERTYRALKLLMGKTAS